MCICLYDLSSLSYLSWEFSFVGANFQYLVLEGEAFSACEAFSAMFYLFSLVWWQELVWYQGFERLHLPSIYVYCGGS